MSSSSRVRYRVVGFMLALGAVTYLDRACIATLAPDILGHLLSPTVERVTRCGMSSFLQNAATSVPFALRDYAG